MNVASENSLSGASGADTTKNSIKSLQSAEWSRSFESIFSDSVKLPKIQSAFAQKSFVSGSLTTRTSALGFNTPQNNCKGTPATQTSERCYYTLAIRVQDILHFRNDNEDHMHLQVSFSMDGMTCTTQPVRTTHEDRIMIASEPVMFQAMGSPVGTLLVVRLLGCRPRSEMTELGMAIVDLSMVGPGGRSSEVSCCVESSENPHVKPVVNLSMRLCARRKSFTFSFLRADPVFRRSGYTVCVEGVTSFPRPYKKAGLPPGVSYFILKMLYKVAEEIHGYEIWRAQDKNGRQYTVKKFLIMEAASRSLCVAEIDGLLDCVPDQAVSFLDAFLDGVKVSIVLDNESGVYLRDALIERGPAPEIVASIILRQVLTALCHLHERCSRLHNDIDARNILCLSSGHIRLGGFCHSIKQIGKAAKFCGPYVHMAPERVLGIECSFPSDIWSLGILAKELALGKGPFDNVNFEDQQALFEFKQSIVSQPSPSLKGVASCSEEFRGFVDMCLQKNIRSRWTAAELLKHPFIVRYESFTLPAGSWLTRQIKPPVVAMSPVSQVSIKSPSSAARDSVKPSSKGSGLSKSPKYFSDND